MNLPFGSHNFTEISDDSNWKTGEKSVEDVEMGVLPSVDVTTIHKSTTTLKTKEEVHAAQLFDVSAPVQHFRSGSARSVSIKSPRPVSDGLGRLDLALSAIRHRLLGGLDRLEVLFRVMYCTACVVAFGIYWWFSWTVEVG